MKEYMHANFEMKDIGHATECIEIRISQCIVLTEIDQIKYVEDIIRKFNLCDGSKFEIISENG